MFVLVPVASVTKWEEWSSTELSYNFNDGLIKCHWIWRCNLLTYQWHHWHCYTPCNEVEVWVYQFSPSLSVHQSGDTNLVYLITSLVCEGSIWNLVHMIWRWVSHTYIYIIFLSKFPNLKFPTSKFPRWLLGLPSARSWVRLSFIARPGVRFTQSFIVSGSVQPSLTLLITKVYDNGIYSCFTISYHYCDIY